MSSLSSPTSGGSSPNGSNWELILCVCDCSKRPKTCKCVSPAVAAGLPGAPGPAPCTRCPGPAHPRAAPAPAEPPLPSALRVLPSQFGTHRSSARGWGAAAGTKTLPSPPPPRYCPHPLPVTRWDAAVLYRKLWAAASGERARHFTTALPQRCNPPGDERSGEGTWLGPAPAHWVRHTAGVEVGAGYLPTGSSLASSGTTSGNAGSREAACRGDTRPSPSLDHAD